MKCITLICTVHDESGQANVPALRSLLDRFRPEVLFLEVPLDALDKFVLGRTNNKLESAAVRQYRQDNGVELIPVDLPSPEQSFFSDNKALQDRLDTPDSRRLLMWNANYVAEHGFAYLNSDHCNQLWSEIYTDMRAAVEALKDQKLAEIFEAWNQTHELREIEMLGNIQKYCREHSFERGAFLIGAAHRQSVIDKSVDYSDGIRWDFASAGGRIDQAQ